MNPMTFIINKTKFNVFISTLNFVLSFIGFLLATSIFLPAVSNMEGITQKVTVPYRAFALLISLIVILVNYRTPFRKLSLPVTAVLLFWVILIIRIIYDVLYSGVHLKGTSQLWFYIFLICIPGFFSVMVSYKSIDLDKSLWWIFILTAMTMVLTLFSNQALLIGTNEVSGRQGGNAAISTIAFGHFGTSSILLGLFALFKKDIKTYLKIISIPLIILGTFCMLRAGSRGPVMALLVVVFFWVFSSQKNLGLSILKLLVIAVITVIFTDFLLTLIGNISPIIESRLRVTIYEGSTGGRDPYYTHAVKAFLDSPVWGKQFALYFPDKTFDYAHNILLDALMGLGLIGGILLTYFLAVAIKKTYLAIKYKDRHYWIFLILLQQIVFNMLSSSFYYNPLLSVLLVFIFFKYQDDDPGNPLVDTEPVTTLESNHSPAQ